MPSRLAHTFFRLATGLAPFGRRAAPDWAWPGASDVGRSGVRSSWAFRIGMNTGWGAPVGALPHPDN